MIADLIKFLNSFYHIKSKLWQIIEFYFFHEPYQIAFSFLQLLVTRKAHNLHRHLSNHRSLKNYTGPILCYSTFFVAFTKHYVWYPSSIELFLLDYCNLLKMTSAFTSWIFFLKTFDLFVFRSTFGFFSSTLFNAHCDQKELPLSNSNFVQFWPAQLQFLSPIGDRPIQIYHWFYNFSF